MVVSGSGERQPAFAVRHEGVVTAYLNQCAHVPVELDWQPGVFFDDEGKFLVCATHGAAYRPTDGRCVGGPCRGRGLTPVPCYELQGSVYVGHKTAIRHSNQHE
ncbi:MAG: Rieske (2Fe-2S) protein [Actinobacteria bacterium]|nr:Rieske (2Fe-2S) protein [Actinomycetota bacterium]